jgi:hypothetical protein
VIHCCASRRLDIKLFNYLLDLTFNASLGSIMVMPMD